MKLWVVNHGTNRQWLKVRVLSPEHEAPREAFIFGEWNARPADEGPGYITPRMPREGPWPNTDPLVIGRDFFFSYCMKGRKSSLSNLSGPNSLEPGDLVLFGGQRRGRVIVDTILVVGEYRVWPEDTARMPDWNLDPVAARVHFHESAHARQHPEVHSTRAVCARSYRGRRWEESRDLFSWVPAFDRIGEPLAFGPEDRLYGLWFGLYNKPAQSYFKTAFPVIDNVTPEQSRAIFKELLMLTKRTRSLVAIQIDLVPEPVSKESR